MKTKICHRLSLVAILVAIQFLTIPASDTDDDDLLLPNLETITVDDNVYVLDDSNYDSFVRQHPVSLVKFYAPWCGHCKSLAPEYARAAKILQDNDNASRRVVLAKVDAAKFTELARKHDVSGYPTLFVYRNGTKMEYDGPRTAQGIVDHMREIADPNFRPPDEAVVTLSGKNFDETIAAEPLMLVQFYAPWCGHCKRLKPEYERAARRLQQIIKPIKLAKVDATVEEELAKRFNITGYPTLLMFRNGKQYRYKGPRDENGIVEYMKQMLNIPSRLVEDKEQLRKEIKEDIPTVVGFFGPEQPNPMFELFADVAFDQFDENNHFVHVTNGDLIQQLKQQPNSVVLFVPLWFRSKYEPTNYKIKLDESTTVTDVVNFIGNHSLPMVGWRNPKTLSLYANRYPLVIVFYDVDFTFDHRKQTQMIRNQVLSAAAQLKNTENITFAIANEFESQYELKELKLDDSGADINVGYYASPQRRYAMEPTDDFTDKSLLEFIETVLTGSLKPVLRSQLVPAQNPDAHHIWTVTGETFDQLVKHPDYGDDIMLEFYAPWCSHCKALEPMYQELARRFKDQRIRFMKMDATANDYDTETFHVRGYPTLYYIKRGGDHPILYEDERTMEKLSQFIEDQLQQHQHQDNSAKEEL